MDCVHRDAKETDIEAFFSGTKIDSIKINSEDGTAFFKVKGVKNAKECLKKNGAFLLRRPV